MKIYELLKQDHFEIIEMLNELVSLDEHDDYRFALVEEINNVLIPHSRAEESVFYNTIRAVDADKTLTVRSYKEHLELEALLRTLQVKEKTHFNWKPTAEKLLESFQNHVAEEEGNVFEEARIIFTDEEAEMMGEAFTKLRPEFEGEGLLKNTFDMVVNMMPPRLADKIRSFGPSSKV